MKKILDIIVSDESKKEILEKIKLLTQKNTNFCHIVSINPENVVISQKDKEFKSILNQAQIRINDGIGILLGSSILGIHLQNKVTGVDVMDKILKMCESLPLRVLFIGGRPKIAERLADCYTQKCAQNNLKSTFIGLEGIKDINTPKNIELERIFSIITDTRPHIVFVAFGSPAQEKWIWQHREKLNCIAMGVGQGFDIHSGYIKRAPLLIRNAGFEWLYRLVTQPWRWKRQLRLIEFIYLILKERVRITLYGKRNS